MSNADWGAAMAQVIAEFDTQHPFKKARVRLEPAGVVFDVAVADTDETRARGMIGQTFDQFDAMLFTYDTDVRHAFHMDGVTEQLYIAFFDADGKIVDHLGMFRKDPYHYRPERSFRYVLELPAETDQAQNRANTDRGSPGSWLEGQTLHIEELN